MWEIPLSWASLEAKWLKKNKKPKKTPCLPMQETHIRSLGWEDPLEKEMASHTSTLAWRITWTEEPGGLAKSQIGLSN